METYSTTVKVLTKQSESKTKLYNNQQDEMVNEKLKDELDKLFNDWIIESESSEYEKVKTMEVLRKSTHEQKYSKNDDTIKMLCYNSICEPPPTNKRKMCKSPKIEPPSDDNDDIFAIVNSLISDELTAQSGLQKNNFGTAVFRSLPNDCPEIGLVDLKLPERKQMQYVMKTLGLQVQQLKHNCNLFNQPHNIVAHDLTKLNTMLEKLNQLKSNVFTKILSILETNGILTNVGVGNIFKLLSHKPEAAPTILPMVQEVKTVKHERNSKQFDKYLRAPYNLLSTAPLSYMLEQIRQNNPLPKEQTNKLIQYVKALLQVSPRALTGYLKMLISNNLLTNLQAECFIKIISQQNNRKTMFARDLFNFDHIGAIDTNDLGKLLTHWPLLYSTGSFNRLYDYLNILKSLEPKKLNKFMKDLKQRCHFNDLKLNALQNLLKYQKRLKKTQR